MRSAMDMLSRTAPMMDAEEEQVDDSEDQGDSAARVGDLQASGVADNVVDQSAHCVCCVWLL